MSQGSDTPTVLVVDDEQEVAEVYALRLGSDYETRTANGGYEALEAISEDVDVVLLDRRMPDLSGEEVLAELRERGYECRVIMLTAVDPGLDIVDMPFDDYLCKPVEKADLVAAIEQQLEIHRRDEGLAEYLEVRTKIDLIESQFPEPGSRNVPELEDLRSRAEELRAELEGSVEDLEAIEASFDEIGRRPG